MTRTEAIATLRAANDDANADVLANVTDGELENVLRAKSYGHAPRNPGSFRERDFAVRAAFAAAGG